MIETKLSDPRVQHLQREDTAFAELCLDYQDCLSILKEIRAESQPDVERFQEYQSLKEALEAEIDEFLRCDADSPTSIPETTLPEHPTTERSKPWLK